ncbi:glycoside hydrolase family 130 protein [Candidatus Margulisiibacteriota bacterium]
MYKRRRVLDIIHRWEGNPLLTITDLSFQSADILNAGVVKYENMYYLLLTIKDLKGTCSLYLAKSTNGIHFEVESHPLLTSSEDEAYKEYEDMGVMDARITYLEDYYYLTYIAAGHHGDCLGLARTKDFESVERLGIISEPDTKAAALFPKKIKDRYALLERPGDKGSIWVSYSSDLVYWQRAEIVAMPRGGYWDCNRIGTSVPPIETKDGWLVFYYGVKETSAGPLYRIGALVLDLENPTIVKGRTNIPILSPREQYERVGDINNVVFSCGAIVEPNEEIKLYYGASNSCMCMGMVNLDDVLDLCLKSTEEY